MTDAADRQLNAAVDNDVLIKAAALDLVDVLVAERAGILGQARFVVAKRVARLPLRGSTDRATERAEALLARCESLEPDEGEIALAAAIERAAALRDLPLDGGESQLTAIVICRSITELHTGDKRAVSALESIADGVNELAVLAGRVRCLEQIVDAAVGMVGATAVGAAICDEPSVDKTLTICSECHSSSGRTVNVAALRSYIERLRAAAPRVLAS
jgi:hypothetical protein